MTLRSPYTPSVVSRILKKYCQCDVTSLMLPERNAYHEIEYTHTLHHAHFDRYGWPTEIIKELDQKYPEFRMRLV